MSLLTEHEAVMGLSLDELAPPLDDIAYLSRSNNRLEVLSTLAQSSQTRRELRDRTGISQPTIGRILEGFEERAWITANDREYALTPFGRLLAEEFEGLMDTVEAIQDLRDLAFRLPLEEMDFDLRLLVAGTITTPKPTDASAHVRREGELLERTETVRFLCNAAEPDAVERYRDWVVDGDREFDAIIAGDAIDAAGGHPAMREHLQDMLAADGVTIYRYDGPVSVMLGCFDDTASIVPLDGAGVPCAFIESEHNAVRAWVVDTLDQYREQAERVATESIPA